MNSRRHLLHALSLALAFLALGTSAHAECSKGEQKNSPEIDSITRSGPNKITLHWTFIAGGVACVYPPDFWQVRWTQGPGPATQHQSPQISVQDVSRRSYTMTLDTTKEWSFVVEACKSEFLAHSYCTPWSSMVHYTPK